MILHKSEVKPRMSVNNNDILQVQSTLTLDLFHNNSYDTAMRDLPNKYV